MRASSELYIWLYAIYIYIYRYTQQSVKRWAGSGTPLLLTDWIVLAFLARFSLYSARARAATNLLRRPQPREQSLTVGRHEPAARSPITSAFSPASCCCCFSAYLPRTVYMPFRSPASVCVYAIAIGEHKRLYNGIQPSQRANISEGYIPFFLNRPCGGAGSWAAYTHTHVTASG